MAALESYRRMRAVFQTAALTFAFVLCCGTTAAHADGGARMRTKDTAYTREGGEVSVGLFDLQLGILDELTIGTYIAPWLLFPLLDTPIPSAFVKVRDWFHGPLSVSLRATLLYIPPAAVAELGRDADIDAALVHLPIEAAVSLELGPRFVQSASLTYVLTQAGASQASSTSIAGALTASQLTLSAVTEYRLTRGFSLTLLARVLVARSNLRAHVRASRGSTQIDAEVGLSTDYGHIVACIVPGVALRGSHVNFEFGLGYGSWWLPIVELPLPSAPIVPEVNFYAVF